MEKEPQTPETGHNTEEGKIPSSEEYLEDIEGSPPVSTFTSPSYSPTEQRARSSSDEEEYVAPSPSISPANRIEERRPSISMTRDTHRPDIEIIKETW